MKHHLLRAAALAALCTAPGLAADNAVLPYPASYFADQRPNTALDMVKRLPGFNFDDGKDARGFAGTAGNVVIDGHRPTSKTDDLQSVLERIPAADVERLELIRGGAPGIDMQGQTVVANVVRKTAEATKVVISAQDNIFPDGHDAPQASLQLTHRAGDSTYEASFTRLGNFSDAVGKGFHDITDVKTGKVKHADARLNGFASGWRTTTAATVPLWGGQFKANLAVEDSPWRNGHFYNSEEGAQTIMDRNGNQSAELGLHWIGSVGGPELEALLLQRLGRQTNQSADDSPTFDRVFASKNKTGESIARATLRYRASPDLRFEAGGEAAYNFLNGTSSYSENGVAVPLPSANANVNEKRGEVFVQGTWTVTPEWTLETGARFEFSTISETGETAVSRSFFYPKPRALITWAPTAQDQFRFRYERVLGQLNFSNFVASADLSDNGVHAGNAMMKPDQHEQFALSYEHDFWNRGALVISLLHEQISDVMDNIPVMGKAGVYDAPGNIGAGHSNELNTVLTVPLDRIGLTNGLVKLTNVWRFSGVRDPSTNHMRRISGQRPQNIQIDLSQDIESLKSTWNIRYFNCWDEYYARATMEQHAHAIPPFIVVGWDYKPTPDWAFRVEVDNIGRFGYGNINHIYAGPRGTSPLISIEETKFKSQPRLFIQIRKTFG